MLRFINHIHANGWNTETNGFNRAVIKRQAYYEVFKISDMSHHFDIVKTQPAEGFHELGPYYRLIEDYARLDINKTYGISLDKFVKMPEHVIVNLMQLSEEMKLKESNKPNVVDEMESALKEQEQRMARLAKQSNFPSL